MQPPSYLQARGREAYLAAVETLRKIGEDPELYGETIARYARACEAEQTALDAWAMDGYPMHAVGSRGSLIVHPIAKAVRDAEIHSDKLAQRLGLSPESRAGMNRSAGRQMGQSQAPDRRLRIAP